MKEKSYIQKVLAELGITSKRGRLLLRTVASDGLHRRFRIRFFERTMHNYSDAAGIVVQNR